MIRVAATATARVSRLGPAALTVGAAAVPAMVALARGKPIGTPFAMACLVAGASVGWAVEDPAANLLASTPVATPTRTVLRAVLVTAVALVAVTIVSVAMAIGPGVPDDALDRAPEACTAAAVALAFGLGAGRNGERSSGAMAVAAGILSVLFVAALAFRWPMVLPDLRGGATHTRWWLITAVALAAAIRYGRDPGRR